MITAVFTDNSDYARATGLWQWDYGQRLRIDGLKLPAAAEIHFALTEQSGDSITRVGTTKDGVTEVVIPDSLLENQAAGASTYEIYAWIYLADKTSGETIKRISMQVKRRAKPEGHDTPEDAELFREAIEAVKEARAQGDLSENFEYYAAKKHKNQNESRIRYLERMLKTASIVSDASRSDEVGMDDIVEVLFEEDNEVEKYKLVTSIRGNSMENRISIESPIGKALRGHRVGDRVEVKVNDDYSYYLVIKSIDKTGSEDEEIRGF